MKVHDAISGKKGAFYGRHSTDKQDIETQLKFSYDIVKEHGGEIVQEFIDDAVSATSVKMEKRQALVSLLKDVEEDKFEFVVIYMQDRIARNPIEHQKLRMFFISKKVPVIISHDKSFYTTGELLSQLMLDGYSKYEVDMISGRMRDTVEEKVSQGIWLGGYTPYGYDYNQEEGKITINPYEGYYVKIIFDLYKNGEGFQAIADFLMEDDPGSHWTKERVKMIITNPFYAGKITMNRLKKGSHNSINEKEKWIMNHCKDIEPLISEKDWEFCWNLYINRKLGGISPKKFKTDYLLRDILLCKICNQLFKGKDYRSKNKKTGEEYGERYYVCERCEIKYEINELHESVLNAVLAPVFVKIFSSGSKSVFDEVNHGFSREINDLVEMNSKLENQIAECSIRINRAEREIDSIYGKTLNEQANVMLSILIPFRVEMNKRIEMINKLIKKNNERIQYVQNIEQDFVLWKEMFHNLIREEYELKDTKLRRLLLYMFEHIEVDRNKRVTSYKARMNLEEDNQHIPGSFM
ncbi:recombinase family protein [Brevibacillus nitrificans]|uniref:recombinase family protein n=1 Tax=Brevibacillus nitrificans TaxID=651560 RepID=UPI00286BD97B|nr:recombinase family protein [Brevibacillus nitrificans]